MSYIQKRTSNITELKKCSRTPVGSQEQKKRSNKSHQDDSKQKQYSQNQTRVKPRMLTTFGSPQKQQSQQQQQRCTTMNVVCRTSSITQLMQRVNSQEQTIRQLNNQIKKLVKQNMELTAENDQLRMSVNSSVQSTETTSKKLQQNTNRIIYQEAKQRSNTPAYDPETPMDVDRAHIESESDYEFNVNHVRREDFVQEEIMRIINEEDEDFKV